MCAVEIEFSSKACLGDETFLVSVDLIKIFKSVLIYKKNFRAKKEKRDTRSAYSGRNRMRIVLIPISHRRQRPFNDIFFTGLLEYMFSSDDLSKQPSYEYPSDVINFP
jgi:hypothetical protein